MIRPRFTVRHVGGSTAYGNRRGPWHVIDQRAPHGTDHVVASRKTRRAATIFARVLNAECLLKPCPRYLPDHNGECLLCDESAGEHSPDAIAAGEPK